MFEAYFKVIKNKLLPRNEVLENIKKYQTNSELKNEKKKLSAYLNFNKNKVLYDFIIDDMKEAFIKSPLLSDYWENKLKLFSFDIRQDYYRQKIDANPFSDEEIISYKFTLDREWIISKFKLVPTIAGEFRSIFYTGLTECLSDKFNTSKGEFSGEGIRISCGSPEMLKEVKSFCHKLVPEIYSLFENFDFNNGPIKGAREANEIINKFALADKLSISLANKTEIKPKVKI